MIKRRKKKKPFIVMVAQDLSEYSHVQVDATSSDEAEEIVSDLLEQGQLTQLEYERGDDREGPYTSDASEKEDDQTVNCIIKNGRVTFPTRPKPPLLKATGPEIESDEPTSYRIEIDRCPLYLTIEATTSDQAIATALTLIKKLTKTETEGIPLPLSEPGEHDTDAIIYPSLDIKDYRIADVESL